MYRIDVRITGTLFNFSPQAMRGAVTQANTQIIKTLLPRYERLARAKLGSYPGPAAGTFKEKATPKQRRYVMMLIRKGIWTGRTGRLLEAWTTYVVNQRNGIELAIENTARNERGEYFATYVVGEDIQSFHADTGWVDVNDDLNTLATELAFEAADVYLDELTVVGDNVQSQFQVTL